MSNSPNGLARYEPTGAVKTRPSLQSAVSHCGAFDGSSAHGTVQGKYFLSQYGIDVACRKERLKLTMITRMDDERASRVAEEMARFAVVAVILIVVLIVGFFVAMGLSAD